MKLITFLEHTNYKLDNIILIKTEKRKDVLVGL